jgi:hypothetical protein
MSKPFSSIIEINQTGLCTAPPLSPPFTLQIRTLVLGNYSPWDDSSDSKSRMLISRDFSPLCMEQTIIIRITLYKIENKGESHRHFLIKQSRRHNSTDFLLST